MIRFDFSGTTRELIKERGIAPEDLEAIGPAVKKAHEQIMKGRQKGEIGFYDLASDLDMIRKTKDLTDKLYGRFKDIVVLGIGGSSLGPKTILSALGDPFSMPGQYFLDNVDPEYMHRIFEQISMEETLFIVVSKSGGTPETAAQFMVVMDMLKRDLKDEFRDHLVFITDAENGILRRFADEWGIQTLSIPANVGGRFSVLSPVGLFPAAMSGIDISGIMEGAQEMCAHCLDQDISKNPAYMFGAIHFLAFSRGANISVLMPYSNALYDLADWYRQIWAESLGKAANLEGKTVFTGQTPVKALGTTDQHSQVQLYMEGPFDKVINLITVEKYRDDIMIPDMFKDIPAMSYLSGKPISSLINAEARGTMGALIKNKRMTNHICLDRIDEKNLGALFMFFEAATAFTGYLLGINPFDQPGVELGKKITFSLMGRQGYNNTSAEYRPVPKMVMEI